jgi:hypothetical protein
MCLKDGVRRVLLAVLLASCGGPPKEPAAVAPPSSAPSASAIVVEPEPVDPSRPIGFDVKESDVVITGGFGSAKDRYVRNGDPKPGDTVEAVRLTCEAKVCRPAEPSTSPAGEAFEQRLRQCVTVKSRAATAKEAAQVTAVFSADTGAVVVPEGRLFVIERRTTHREEIKRELECPKDGRHPCDPAMVPTGKFVDRTYVEVYGVGPRDSSVLEPFTMWKLHWFELTRMPGPLDTVDLSKQPPAVRAALAFNRAVEAVRSKDRARITAAVKAVEANVTIAEGVRIEDMSVPRSVAQTIINELPHIRAVGEGRATVGDACKRTN